MKAKVNVPGDCELEVRGFVVKGQIQKQKVGQVLDNGGSFIYFNRTIEWIFLKMGQFFVYFCLFINKIEVASRIRIRIVRVEGDRVDFFTPLSFSMVVVVYFPWATFRSIILMAVDFTM